MARQKAQKLPTYNGNTQRRNLVIKRDSAWLSTLKQIINIPLSNFILDSFKIQFEDEQGIDAEWLVCIAREIFNPLFGLFELSENKSAYQPNPFSFIVPDHLTHFRMIGRLIGKTLIDGLNFQTFFTRSFLKHILKKSIYIKDIEDIDHELYTNLNFILENEIDQDDLLYFSYDRFFFGKRQEINLKENGKSIIVINENKKEFVKLRCYAKMVLEIKEQTQAFLQGFLEVVPQESLYLLDEKELGLYLAGKIEVDIDDLQRNTNGYSSFNQNIVWLFEILREFDQVQRANFIFYVSGTFKIPVNGFKDRPMVIQTTSAIDKIPISHTCFNTIDLGRYSSKPKMKQLIEIALNFQNEGFYIA